jgi:hypothetical protein
MGTPRWAAKFLQALPREGEGCVTWPYARRPDGYGAAQRSNGRTTTVARVVCEMFYGPAPDQTMEAAHSCGKGHLGCVAPWHISWKTPKENQADRLIHGTDARGEKCYAAKLSAQDVADIRVLAKAIVQSDIAKHYGVSPATICLLLKGKTWKKEYRYGDDPD